MKKKLKVETGNLERFNAHVSRTKKKLQNIQNEYNKEEDKV